MPESDLRNALAELAERGRHAVASPEIETRLRAMLAHAIQPRPSRRGFRRAAVAAGICLAAALGWQLGREHPRQPAPPATLTFRLLPFADPPGAIHDPQIRRVLLSPQDLAALGLPPRPLDAAAPVAAELLVNDDGTPEAIRFLDNTQ